MFSSTLCCFIIVASSLAPLPALAQPTRRPQASRSLPVTVQLHIDNLVSVDEQRETWQLTGELTERWKEPKLAYIQRAPGNQHRDLPHAPSWEPHLGFTNEATPASLTPIDRYVRPDGTVVNVARFNVTLSTQLDLRRFPFDEQRLPIVLEPQGHDADRVVLSADIRHSSLEKARYVELSQWRMPALSARAVTRQNGDYPVNSLVFTVTVHRGSNSYVWKYLIPLFLIVLLSWVSFWLSHEEFKTKDQLGTLVSTLLIIVAFNITAHRLAPPHELCYLYRCFSLSVLHVCCLRNRCGSRNAYLANA